MVALMVVLSVGGKVSQSVAARVVPMAVQTVGGTVLLMAARKVE
jgi:hypothetical protein